jgi:hypothetical protein
MSQSILVGGPTFWCVGVGGGSTLAFLGICEGVTRIHFDLREVDVHTDGSGDVPFDVLYRGEQATIQGDLIRYDDQIAHVLLSGLPSAGGVLGSQNFGTIPAGSIGALRNGEGNSIRFLVYCPYSAKAAFSAAGMIPGYNFLSAWATGAQDISVGTQAKRIRIRMRAIPKWTLTAAGFQGVLCNTDVSGIPTIT